MTEWIKAREVLSRAGLNPAEHRKRSPLGAAVLDRVKADCAKMRGKRYTIDGQPCSSSTIGPIFFTGPKVWADWISGNFECHSSMRDHSLIDAEFALEDIADLIEAYKVTPSPPLAGASHAPERPKGGNPGKVELWHRFWLEAMRLLHTGEIDNFETQADFRRALLDHIDNGITEDHAKPQVRKIWHILGKL